MPEPFSIYANFVYRHGEEPPPFELGREGKNLNTQLTQVVRDVLLHYLPDHEDQREGIAAIRLDQGKTERVVFFCAGDEFIVSLEDVEKARAKRLDDATKFLARSSPEVIKRIHGYLRQFKRTHAVLVWPWGTSLDELLTGKDRRVAMLGEDSIAIQPRTGMVFFPAPYAASNRWRELMWKKASRSLPVSGI
jgi:hypothetical protein